MIWSAIAFYRNGPRFSGGYNPRILTFPQQKERMVSCYLRSKVDLTYILSVTRLTDWLYDRIGKN